MTLRALFICLALILSGAGLSGCSMEAMADKLVPGDVRTEVDAQIDALVAGDSAFIFDAFPDDREDPNFRDQMTRMVEAVPDSSEISRDVVGVQSQFSSTYSSTDGAVRSGTVNLAHELAFEDGRFLLVQTAHTLDEAGDCCVLRAIKASVHDTSPYRAGQISRAKIMRILGLLVGLSTLGTIAFLIIRIGGRKARAASGMDAP